MFLVKQDELTDCRGRFQDSLQGLNTKRSTSLASGAFIIVINFNDRIV